MIKLGGLALLLAFASCGQAPAASAPTDPYQGDSDRAQTKDLQTPKPPALEIPPQDNITQLQVLIFPHLGKYSIPEGREKDLTHVSLISTGHCQEIGAKSSRQGSRLDYSVHTLKDPVTVTCDQPVTLKRDSSVTSYKYIGAFQIKVVNSATYGHYLRVINTVTMEDYVKGVVPSEIPSSWDLETLKAQAIAARTYATYETLNTHANTPDQDYDLDDTVLYQAYLGMSGNAPSSDEAVNLTQGRIMTDQGKVIKAYFHSDSGGITEDADHLFGTVLPYCVGKRELFPYTQVPGNPWHVVLSYAQISERLIAEGLISPGSSVVELKVGSKQTFESGRIRSIDLKLSSGKTYRIDGQNFRLAIGLKSTLFTVSSKADVTFTGRGAGHGVGMSQWGARILSQSFGYDYLSILNFYYTGIQISNPQQLQ